MRSINLAACAAILIAGHSYAAAPNMKEGLWESTTKMEMAGMPGGGMPPQTMRRCVTKKDLEDPAKTTPGADVRDSRCRVTDYQLQGNTATWKMACEGENAMTGSGTITYSGTSYSGTQSLTMKQGGQTHNMTMQFAARHVGECK